LDARTKLDTDITFNNRFAILETTPNSDSGSGQWNLLMANNRNVYFTGGATNAADRTTSAGIQFVGTNLTRFGDLDVQLGGEGLVFAKLPDGLFSGKFLRVITPNGAAFVNVPGDGSGDDSNKLKNLSSNLRNRLSSLINNQFKGVTIPLNEDAIQTNRSFNGNPSSNAGLGGTLF
jgi:hypothetical protein